LTISTQVNLALLGCKAAWVTLVNWQSEWHPSTEWMARQVPARVNFGYHKRETM